MAKFSDRLWESYVILNTGSPSPGTGHLGPSTVVSYCLEICSHTARKRR